MLSGCHSVNGESGQNIFSHLNGALKEALGIHLQKFSSSVFTKGEKID